MPPTNKAFSERVPPHSLEAEQSVLGACLIDREALVICQTILRAEDFYADDHGYIWVAMQQAAAAGAVDLITLQNQLRDMPSGEEGKTLLDKVGGLPYLTNLINTVPTTANVEQYARIVEQKATLRRLQIAAWKVADSCYTAEDVDRQVAQSEALIQQVTIDRQGNEQLEGFEGITRWIEQYALSSDDDLLHTGLDDLDEVYEIRRRKVYGFAGPPKMGKSALLRQMALNQAEDGLHVLFISLEEDKTAQRLNFLAMVSGVERIPLRRRLIRPDDGSLEWLLVRDAARKLESLPIKFDYTPEQNVAQIKAKIQYYALTWGVDVVYIDTQNAVTEEKLDKNELTTEKMVRMVRQWTVAAKRANCAVIVAVQAGQDIQTRDSMWMTPMDVSESKLMVQAFTGVVGVLRPEKIRNPKSRLDHRGERLFALDKRWKNVMLLFVVANREGDENTITPIYCDMRSGKIGNLVESYWPWRVPVEEAPPEEAFRKREERQRMRETGMDPRF